MKNLKTLAFLLVVTSFTVAATAQTKAIDVAKSTINWVGKKVTGQHEGTINLKDGALVFNGAKLTGGTFTADMSTINTTDLKPGEGKEKLDGHLKADDFFGTANYPTAKLVFKTIADKGNNTYTIVADMTIKAKTNPVTFDIIVKNNAARTKLVIDRTKYDIKYGSGSFFDNLGDKTISDDFDLNVVLQF